MSCVFIYAGSGRQFDNWCAEQHVSRRDPRFRYLRHGDVDRVLMGTTNPIVIRVGTWYERSDLGLLETVLASRCHTPKAKESPATGAEQPHGASPSGNAERTSPC